MSDSAALRAEGFTQLALMATLPGVPLYKAFGFTPEVESVELPMPDGVTMACVSMSKPIDVVQSQSQSRATHD